MTVKRNYVSRNQQCYLDYIEQNSGCSIADIVRACRHNPLAGHKWIYDSVHRLEHRGMIRIEYFGKNATRCYLPEDWKPWKPGTILLGSSTYPVAFYLSKPYYNRQANYWVRVPNELTKSIRYD